jgi:hypothetical protein
MRSNCAANKQRFHSQRFRPQRFCSQRFGSDRAASTQRLCSDCAVRSKRFLSVYKAITPRVRSDQKAFTGICASISRRSHSDFTENAQRLHAVQSLRNSLKLLRNCFTYTRHPPHHNLTSIVHHTTPHLCYPSHNITQRHIINHTTPHHTTPHHSIKPITDAP